MLEPEPLIVARLAEIAGLRGVHGLPDLSLVEGAGKSGPCVYLIYDGYTVLEKSAGRDAARIQTRWLAVIAVKHVAKAGDGAPARSSIMPLVDAVIGKLLGWVPKPGITPLALDNAPRPEFMAGQLFFPLAFSCAHVVRGMP